MIRAFRSASLVVKNWSGRIALEAREGSVVLYVSRGAGQVAARRKLINPWLALETLGAAWPVALQAQAIAAAADLVDIIRVEVLHRARGNAVDSVSEVIVFAHSAISIQRPIAFLAARVALDADLADWIPVVVVEVAQCAVVV